MEDLTGDQICAIIRACQKTKIKSLRMGAVVIEFWSEGGVEESLAKTVPAAPSAETPAQSAWGSTETPTYESKLIKSPDDPMIREMIIEDDMMANDPMAWETRNIDKLQDTRRVEELDPNSHNDSPGYKAFNESRSAST